MLYFKIFINALKKAKESKLDSFFMFFQLIVLSGLFSAFRYEFFFVFNFFFSFIFVIIRDRSIVYDLVKVFFVFFLLSFLPAIIFGFEIKIYVGFFLRILTAVFIIQFYKKRFFDIFENIVFILAYIDLFFFVGQQLIPSISEFLKPISHLLSDPQNYIEGNHFYLIYHLREDVFSRNSGFMWEPAAFGGVIAWSIIINLYNNKFSFNEKLIVLLLAGCSTFSLGFYSYLIIIFGIFVFENKVNKSVLILAIFIFGAFAFILNTNLGKSNIQMMTEKIDGERGNNIQYAMDMRGTREDISRVGGFIVNGRYFAKWPFGYGLTPKGKENRLVGASSNSLMNYFVKWGLLGVIIIIISAAKTSRFLKYFYKQKISIISYYLTLLLILFPFIGNPFVNQPLALSILLWGHFGPKYILVHKESIHLR